MILQIFYLEIFQNLILIYFLQRQICPPKLNLRYLTLISACKLSGNYIYLTLSCLRTDNCKLYLSDSDTCLLLIENCSRGF